MRGGLNKPSHLPVKVLVKIAAKWDHVKKAPKKTAEEQLSTSNIYSHITQGYCCLFKDHLVLNKPKLERKARHKVESDWIKQLQSSPGVKATQQNAKRI